MIVANNAGDSPESRRDSSLPPWTELLDRIKRNDKTALEDLYRVFSGGVRFYLCRQLGYQDLDDRVNDTFLLLVRAIQQGDVREPERLLGYVYTIVRRQVAAQIETNVQSRKRKNEPDLDTLVHDAGSNSEQAAVQNRDKDIACKVLKSIAPRGLHMLMRFFVEEQLAGQIREERGLSEIQFHKPQSRAKFHFWELAKQKNSIHLMHFEKKRSQTNCN